MFNFLLIYKLYSTEYKKHLYLYPIEYKLRIFVG